MSILYVDITFGVVGWFGCTVKGFDVVSGGNEKQSAEKQYAIGAVVKLTGLTAHAIRVWEKRHQAVVADRLSSGRRVYRQSHLDRLLLLKQCTDQGFSIGSVASLSDQELRATLANAQSSSWQGGVKQSESAASFTLTVLGSKNLALSLKQNENLKQVEHHDVSNWSQVHLDNRISDCSADILVLEVMSLTSISVSSILELIKRCSPKFTVLVYRFANKLSLTALRNQGVRLAKAPLDEESLISILEEFFIRGGTKASSANSHTLNIPQLTGEYPPHLFSSARLAKVADLPTKVECECPHHLVDLLEGLKAFERYSGDCVNKNDQDAALHDKIQRTTADARYQLEMLLQEVLEVEGIEI